MALADDRHAGLLLLRVSDQFQGGLLMLGEGNTQQKIALPNEGGGADRLHPQLIDAAHIGQQDPQVRRQIYCRAGGAALPVKIDPAGKHQPGTEIVQGVQRIEPAIFLDVHGVLRGDVIQQRLFGGFPVARLRKVLQRGQAVFQLQLQRILKVAIARIAQRRGKADHRGLADAGDRRQVKGAHKRRFFTLFGDEPRQQPLALGESGRLFRQGFMDPLHISHSVLFFAARFRALGGRSKRAQVFDLLRAQIAPGPGWQVCQLYIPLRHALQRVYRIAAFSAHPADLPVFALSDGNGHHIAVFRLCQQTAPGRQKALSVQLNRPGKGLLRRGQAGLVRRELHQILLIDLMGGVHQMVGQLAVVGEQQQALGMHIQPPHGIDPLGHIPDQIGHRPAARFVT